MYGVSFPDDLRQEMREDIVEEFSAVTSILNAAPWTSGSFYIVPAGRDAPVWEKDEGH
jgi:hypothetical protein